MGEKSREEALALLTEKIRRRLGEDRLLEPFEDNKGWEGTDSLLRAQREIVEEAVWSVSRQTGVEFNYPEFSTAFVQAMINLGKYSENGRGRSRFSPEK